MICLPRGRDTFILLVVQGVQEILATPSPSWKMQTCIAFEGTMQQSRICSWLNKFDMIGRLLGRFLEHWEEPQKLNRTLFMNPDKIFYFQDSEAPDLHSNLMSETTEQT